MLMVLKGCENCNDGPKQMSYMNVIKGSMIRSPRFFVIYMR